MRCGHFRIAKLINNELQHNVCIICTVTSELNVFLKMARLVTHEELKSATGFDNNAALEKCLRNQKIPVLYGKDGHVFTTLDAINNALGLSFVEQNQDQIEFLR